eukprot:Unigene11870_Nuclearia_a/m.36144 Unigene11870_Nuclearia_a/g.36144  ORF Unigene11870_Nuclearia_a/g.36144 Unigene11870_Nuclearia_a/m.36144 type:complete len:182 (-) Unigene11870_Nuclearia_a:941-1486(-)
MGSVTVRRLIARRLTREAFAPYGEVIEPIFDFSREHEHDVALDLTQGQPRFYVMALDPTGLLFDKIARHLKTTQCLGSAQGLPWYLGVAAPEDVGNASAKPRLDTVAVFYVPGELGVKLHRGTWHAGPLFTAPAKHLFYNLELMDTNVADFLTHDWVADERVRHEFDADPSDHSNVTGAGP